MGTKRPQSARSLEWWWSVVLGEMVLENYDDPVEAFKMVRRLQEAIGADIDLDLHIRDALGRNAWALCERQYQAARAGR